MAKAKIKWSVWIPGDKISVEISGRSCQNVLGLSHLLQSAVDERKNPVSGHIELDRVEVRRVDGDAE